jgi:hypothetical protein
MRLDRIGKLVEPPVPAGGVGRTVTEQIVDERTLLDRCDGRVHAPDFGVECVDRP